MPKPNRARLLFLLVALESVGCSGSPGEEVASGTGQALEDSAFASIPRLPTRAQCARNVNTAAIPGRMYCHAQVVTNEAGLVQTAATPQGFGPAELAAAYNIPKSTSTATIAIVDAQDDPDAEADLGTYRMHYGLPACTTKNGCFKKVDQRGGTTYPAPDTGWAGEIMLDIEMASAACPTCKILLVEADTADMTNLGAAVNQAAALGATVISNSYGGSEDNANAATDSAYFVHPGVAIFASSGDGSFGVEYPAAGGPVIGVGGTTLRKVSNTRGYSERAWNGAGSGCSQFTTKPSWQTTSACANKVVADLSAVADPNTGVAVYDRYGSGGWAVYGGTSVASPLVASIFATTGLGTATGAAVWGNAGDFRDATKGNNGTCSPKVLCTAGVGWDGPTGIGTPIGTKLAKLKL